MMDAVKVLRFPCIVNGAGCSIRTWRSRDPNLRTPAQVRNDHVMMFS